MAEIIRYVDPDAVGGGTGVDWANAYTSMALWDAGEQTNLVSDGDWHHLFTRASSGTPDSTNCNLSGWTTGVSNYILVESESGNSDFQTSEYTRTATLTIYEDNVRIKNMQFDLASSNGIVLNGAIVSPDIRIEGCYFKGNSSGTVYAIITEGSGTGTIKLWNNIINDFPRAANLLGNSNLSLYIENNTVYNATYGFMDRESGAMTMKAKNNYIDSSNDPFFGTWANDDAFNDYNVISRNDAAEVAIGTNGKYNTFATFVDAPNDNLSLDVTDTACKDSGDDLSSGDIGFSNDINGNTRTGTWDIGADELQAAPPSTNIPVIQNSYRRRRAS